MGVSTELVVKLLIVTALLIAGYVLVRFKYGYVVDSISKFLLYVVIPINLALTLLTSKALSTYAKVTLGAIAHLAIVSVLALLIFPKLIRSDGKSLCSSILLASLPNSIFLPVSMSVLIFGSAELVLHYSVAFSVVLALIAPLVLATYGGYGGSLSALSVLKKLLTFPPTAAFLVALALKAVMPDDPQQPTYILTLLKDYVSQVNLLGFMVMGSALGLVKLGVNKLAFSLVTTWRFLVSLVIGVSVAYLLGISGLWFLGVVIQSVMPPAVTNIILARTYRLNEELVSTAVITLTPISIVLTLIAIYLLNT